MFNSKAKRWSKDIFFLHPSFTRARHELDILHFAVHPLGQPDMKKVLKLSQSIFFQFPQKSAIFFTRKVSLSRLMSPRFLPLVRFKGAVSVYLHVFHIWVNQTTSNTTTITIGSQLREQTFSKDPYYNIKNI